MPSKKKKQKSKKTKSKKSAAKILAHRGKKSLKTTRGKKSLRRGSRGTQTSKKAKVSRTKPRIDALSDIERDIRNRGPVGASGALSDFQGLSRKAEADSESVEELVQEGNIFESGAVTGVEEADNQDAREVHTRELSEDDVPDEYLDKD
jgi:hypothetical protein